VSPLRRREVLLVGLALLLTLPLFRFVPAFAGSRSPVWPRGVVRLYDASGMTQTVATAAERWNDSGAHVHFDLGYSTSIGRAPRGRNFVYLRQSLGGPPRPLSVWVAAHELGHVIGLHHRRGRDCSVMSPRAFDTRCAPSLAATQPTADELACVPAPSDVDVAAKLYGGAAATHDPRCK
jgi:hypothetical protein